MVAEMIRGGGQLSPGERYVTRWDGFEKAWFVIDTETGESRNLTGDLEVPFHDILDDHPDALRSYGSAGWTPGDAAFVVYDQFDVWAIDPTGSRSCSTNGRSMKAIVSTVYPNACIRGSSVSLSNPCASLSGCRSASRIRCSRSHLP